jgi:fructokinase
VLDLNLRPPFVSWRVIEDALSNSSVVKMSEQEWHAVKTLSPWITNMNDLFSLNERLQYLCITCGARGARLLSQANQSWTVDGGAIDPVDTVGAGDAFTAGLLDGFARTSHEGETLRRAHQNAILVLGHRGGLPRAPDQTQY